MIFHATVLHEKYTLLMSQALLSSWSRSNTNGGKGLFVVIVLVGLITLKQTFLSDFV